MFEGSSQECNQIKSNKKLIRCSHKNSKKEKEAKIFVWREVLKKLMEAFPRLLKHVYTRRQPVTWSEKLHQSKPGSSCLIIVLPHGAAWMLSADHHTNRYIYPGWINYRLFCCEYITGLCLLFRQSSLRFSRGVDPPPPLPRETGEFLSENSRLRPILATRISTSLSLRAFDNQALLRYMGDKETHGWNTGSWTAYVGNETKSPLLSCPRSSLRCGCC